MRLNKVLFVKVRFDIPEQFIFEKYGIEIHIFDLFALYFFNEKKAKTLYTYFFGGKFFLHGKDDFQQVLLEKCVCVFIPSPRREGSLFLRSTRPEHIRRGRTWSEYFHTFQFTKRVEINLLIPLLKSKKYTFQLFLYIYRSQNMQKNQYL